MATKTISLELDAYERLEAGKRAGESFSDVVRRATFVEEAPTGEELRAYCRAGGGRVAERYLAAVEGAAANDVPPDDPWA